MLPSTTQLPARIVLYRLVSLRKHFSYGYQVARIDYEPPSDHESARADARGLAEDDAIGHRLE